MELNKLQPAEGSKKARRRVGRGIGSGLGKTRWPVERTLSWMHQKRRLRVRYEKRADIHEAFMILAEAMICWKALQRRGRSFC